MLRDDLCDQWREGVWQVRLAWCAFLGLIAGARQACASVQSEFVGQLAQDATSDIMDMIYAAAPKIFSVIAVVIGIALLFGLIRFLAQKL